MELFGVVGAGFSTQGVEVLVMLPTGVVELAAESGEGGAVLGGGTLSGALLGLGADASGVGLGGFLAGGGAASLIPAARNPAGTPVEATRSHQVP